jgi:hypothetical protein
MQPRVLVILPYFGPWPAWFGLFLESCRTNPTINWLIPTDQAAPSNTPPNVEIETRTFTDYMAHVSHRLGVRIAWQDAYKLCDLKPMLGHVHADRLGGFDYWGFGDTDVIYGDIRAIYGDEVWAYDVISTHDDIVAGHFALVRNTPKLRRAYRWIPLWKQRLGDPAPRSLDETWFSKLFLPRNRLRLRDRLLMPKLGTALFREHFSTDIRPRPWVDGSQTYPTEWTWDQGRLTNDHTGEREFLYVHLSHWASNRWTREPIAPWKTALAMVPVKATPLRYSISRRGFEPIGGEA